MAAALGKVLCGSLAWSCLSAAAAIAAPLELHECRLEHPLRLTSIAARCGVLKVPEDRTQEQGPTVDLSVAVVRALNRRSAAPPLFLLAGGPGQGATAMYTSYAAAFARVNRNRDIVLVDQRGTGNSAPLTCDYPDDWQAPSEPLPALRQRSVRIRRWMRSARSISSSHAAGDRLIAPRRSRISGRTSSLCGGNSACKNRASVSTIRTQVCRSRLNSTAAC